MIKTKGFKDLDRVLRKAPKTVKDKVTGKMALRMANIMAKKAKEGFPAIKPFIRKSGNTKFNPTDLKQSISKFKRKGDVGIYYLVGSNKGRYDWLHWIEFGTLYYREKPLNEPRRNPKGSKRLIERKAGMKKNPFFRRAFLNAQLPMVNKVKKEIGKVLAAEISKL